MNTENKQPEPTEIHAQAKQRKELRHLGSVRLQPGQKLWEMEVATGTIQEATYKTEVIVTADGSTTKRKLVVKEGHLYAPAINARNADKKFIEQLTGMKYKAYLEAMGFEVRKR